MPPIPVHLDAPINTNAAKADASTPETAAPQQQQQPLPSRTTAGPTTATFDASLPPPPQPGAVPKPPSFAAPTATSSSPPGPQPGASATTGRLPSSVTATVTTTVTQPVAPPPQFSIPPPSVGANPTRSTYAAAPAHAAFPGPTTLNMGPAPTGVSEHPPGYVQNPYAGDGTAAQRARLEDVKALEEGEGEGMWGSVKGVLGKVGQSLKKGEEEAWKYVEGKRGSEF